MHFSHFKMQFVFDIANPDLKLYGKIKYYIDSMWKVYNVFRLDNSKCCSVGHVGHIATIKYIKVTVS